MATWSWTTRPGEIGMAAAFSLERARELQLVLPSVCISLAHSGPVCRWASWNATPAVYQNASIKLVAAQNPTMPPAQVLAQAISDYNKASQTFIIATMDAVRATCPNCKVGMYSYPIRAYWDGYCSSFGPALRNVSDSMIDVFHASDALFPSIYEFYDTAPASQKKQYVDCMVGEAVRLANSSVPPKRVLPYGWPRYHSAANNLLTPSDTDLSFAEPGRIPGVTGAVIWGDAGDNTTRVAELQAWMQANKGVFSVPPSRQHALWQSKPAGASSVTLPGQQVPALSAGPSIAAAAELVEQVRNSPVGSFPPPFEFCGL